MPWLVGTIVRICPWPPEGNSWGILFTTILFTGPAGLSYVGEIPSNPDSPIVVSHEDGLTFELRVLEGPTGALETTVCESVANAPFRLSTVLMTRRATPIRSCLQAFGSFSQPYEVDVRFKQSFSDSSALTERKIVVVLGDDCDATGIRSSVFKVIG